MNLIHDYIDADFKDMLYLVNTDEELTKTVSELTKFQEFKKEIPGIPKKKLISYIAFCYDRRSPVVKGIDDLVKRKMESAQLAKFTVDKNGKFEEVVEGMMRCKIDNVNQMIIRYCRIMGNDAYSTLVTLREAYYDILSQTSGNAISMDKMKDVKDKSDMFGKIETMKGVIERYKNELLEQDKTERLSASLYRVIDQEAGEYVMTPERWAKRFAEL